MRMEVTAINLLPEGGAAVDVRAVRAQTKLSRRTLETATFRVCIPAEHVSDSMGDLEAIAMETIAEETAALARSVAADLE